jgi:tRNA A-37 threonylcarbamoyl transferase component Bud32
VLGQLDLASQSTFAGRYRVLRRLAAGGMGAVFEVVHIETERRRALKVMLPELLNNKQLRERFQMEARITANVASEYIVDVFDAGIDDTTGMPFLVMELLNGEDLSKILQRSGALSFEQVIVYLRQVASALDKTHAALIVHRDLKPENLFLTHREDGTPRVKILDFGISRVVSEASSAPNATRGVGTPLYMAPEQVHAQGLSPSTDLYALGLIAYTLLVGVAYWQSDADRFDNPITFVVHASKGVVESASQRAALVGRELPVGFDAWFRKATHLLPASRFRSASEQVSALAAVLGVEEAPLTSSFRAPGVVVPRAFGTAAATAETLGATTEPAGGLEERVGATVRPPSRSLLRWLAVAAVLLSSGALAALLWPRGSPASSVGGRELVSALPAVPVTAPPLASLAEPSSSVTPPEAQAVAGGEPSAVASKVNRPSPAKLVPAKPPTIGSGPGRRKYTRD